ncbi:glycosyltransferase [Thermosediminibacter litoriperuensis]|uniref:Cellulose synthase/poly-beta-1,6-N-acetylglucosamine synthase-like glycosyltransferase n=1 Tax=Thermosediminibacter litoriperuensis TaxID=291989 RepID=A0A5S5AHA6_9FIRM|nr:glycosyltransferase family 2 protein [Thermosediminibacter litoriperuensis]TYP49780.1 cellulose synthase/poly-beta-1,6-N-acetylglucosamine synthase-like glycosyltransferase [Thermosediminibacter litoriperuensis]
MTLPEKIYLLAVGLYIFFFFLFLRYFLWQHYAKKHYWSRRRPITLFELKKLAREKRKNLPMFSILVPAREEAEVIGQTIEHLARLNYPHHLLEIIIITDEKELQKGGPVTTQQVVEAKILEFRKRKNAPTLKHVIVPYDFDGYFGGTCTGSEVPSTKGRALNYGLSFIDKNSDICGFYDAESHPELDVLRYIAYRWLISDKKDLIWQGPVFQVRNFFFLSPITKIASLYQALAHEWYLPVLMRQLPFVGGTNLFIESKLLKKIGGFDFNALTEDLEIGVRAFLERDAWPEYFPYVSTEQTPENYRAFFRQRLRWASGHIQVIEKFKDAAGYDTPKRNRILKTLLLKGEVEWTLYQLAVLVPPVILLLTLKGWVKPVILPEYLQYILKSFVFIYFGFTYYIYFRYSRYMKSRGITKKLLALIELLILPLAGFLLPLPYSCAIVLRALNRQPKAWCKTPRTREASDISVNNA